MKHARSTEAAAGRARKRAAALSPAVALVLAGSAAPIFGQSSQPPPWSIAAPQQPGQLQAFSGRDFGGLRLGVAPQNGEVLLAASRATVWDEQGPTGVVHRAVLRGDVRITLGLSTFAASAAIVWIEPIGDPAAAPGSPPATSLPPGERRPRQFAVYFDRVSEGGGSASGGDAAASQAGDRLLVTGVVDGTVTLRADAFVQGRPQSGGDSPADIASPAAFLTEGEARLARLLAELSLPPDQRPAVAKGKPKFPPFVPSGGKGEPPATAVIPGAAPGAASPGGPEVAPQALPAATSTATRTPRTSAPLVPGMSQPFEPDSPLTREDPGFDVPPRLAAPAERTPPIFAAGGILTFAVGEATVVADGDSSAVIITPAPSENGGGGSGVIVQYTETRRDRQLQLTADRAVVFLEPGDSASAGGGLGKDLRLGNLSADRVQGLYLEGNVIATDGRFTLRGPQIYYDLKANRAYMVDAVFWTYDARRGLPLYVRAKSLMQTAANQVTGEGVTLANSSFFQPHLSIGASSITITREQSAPVEAGTAGAAEGLAAARTAIDATDITLRAGTLPFFYFPRFKGDVEKFPLRDVRIENSSDSGFAVKTSWNLFALFGSESPPGTRLDLLVDGYSLRGPAIGLDGRYDLGSQSGEILAYLVPDDRGRDTLTSGSRIERDGETRGMFLGEHRWSIDEHWWLFLEGAYLSDENFADALYEPVAETRRELATSAYLRRLDGNSSLSILAKGNLNDFIANEYLLQSQGYTVQKLPEIDYARVADSLFDGAILWNSDYRFSHMAMAFEKKTPAELGFDTPLLSNAAFGLAPGARIDDALRATGLFQSSVLRFDTRHELSAKLDLGPIRINPFGVGRFTSYDDDFAAFSPNQDDEHRYWAGGGVRASTSIQTINDSVESRLFDLHRTRHIIEPSVTAFAAGTNVESRDLPVYDETVENIADGSAIKLGINQTWQTQRGGEGKWRSVDFLKLNTELVYSSDDAPVKSPIGRFFDYRPEFSVLGDFATIDLAWQVTDAVGLTVNEIYDLNIDQSSRTTAGGIIQHSQDFSSFAEVHYLNARDSTFVSLGADYRLTRKWTLGIATTYDVDQTDFQEIGARLNREFPSAIVSLKIKFNNITDEVAFGFVLQPKFADDRLVQLRRLGRDQLDLGEVPEDAVRPGSRPSGGAGGGGGGGFGDGGGWGG